ncbi:MAG: 2,3-bisphosphoglycerate-independent phosphoglycerate mutase [Deltaproteobacteria bacterium]|nr:2,3-bisphosphoglycerate-independent phosphoglycerate mutase [Deltaproteobacteria bacterium]
MRKIAVQTESKIVLIVIDGLGGLPDPQTGKTELETAATPNLDALAANGICGLIDPVSPGITPGSGPGHLAIFGYDPIRFDLGRGILEAAGIDFDLKEHDVAARGNFATIDSDGKVTDRRAGRILTEKNKALCKMLEGIKIDETEVIVRPIKEHRFLAVFRGSGLSPELSDTDPQETGVAAKETAPRGDDAEKCARIVNRFVSEAKDKLSEHHPANMILLRGFSGHPKLPTMAENFKLNAAAIAVYPMYRGVSRLLGMEVPDSEDGMEDQFETLVKEYERFDFMFLHVKHSDSAGEDGNFQEKAMVIEHVDRLLPLVTDLEPDVLAVTGDHSTPAVLKGHSWHPVPIVISAEWCRPDGVREFSESACLNGGIGRLAAVHIMPLLMANALKLKKFGA